MASEEQSAGALYTTPLRPSWLAVEPGGSSLTKGLPHRG